MNMLTLAAININWEILFANGPSLIIVSFLCLVVYAVAYLVTYGILENFDFYVDCDDSAFEYFLKTNCVLVPTALLIWALTAWFMWSTKVLNKPENANKPIIEHVQDK